MTKRAAILGSSGYVGGELMRLLAGGPFEVAAAFANTKAGETLDTVHPHLSLAYPGLAFDAYAPEKLNGADVVFAALPHGETQKIADDLMGCGAKIVDLGADFRLDSAEAYAQWYGHEHHRPDLLGRFVYGLPELCREKIRSAQFVAAPGCYPTAATLALKPIVDAGLIDATQIVVDAASGVSGAGGVPKPNTHFNTVDENLSASGLVNHRHTSEMEMNLGGRVLFTPHLAPMNRGILATCSAPAAKAMDPMAPLEALKAAYKDEPFVHATEQSPAVKWALGANSAFVTARYDPRTERVIAICALDNLCKGAAGQMLQCATLMFGLPETSGLPVAGVYP